MNKNAVIIELIETARSKKSSEICVTVYMDRDELYDKQLAELVRPHILDTLKSFAVTTNTGALYREVADALINQIDELDDRADGMALFFIIDTQYKPKGKSNKALRYSKLVPLFTKPTRETYVGQVFNIAQLLHSFKVQPSAFALDVTRDRATLYLFDKHQCTHIHTFETEVLPEGDAEYTEKQAATGMIHGTGQDKIERRHQEENKYLLHQLQEVLTQMQEQVQDIGSIVIAYTSQFDAIVDDFVETLQKDLPAVRVLTLQKRLSEHLLE